MPASELDGWVVGLASGLGAEMTKPTAFEKMRKHKAAREQRAAEIRAFRARMDREAEILRMEREWRDSQVEIDKAEFERKHKAELDRVFYEAGMAMWGADLQACLLAPVLVPVPAPPVYGGERYKMMTIPRPEVKL